MMDRIYALLLRAFPAQSRERYGAEMLDAFRHGRRTCGRERGAWGAYGFVLAAYADVVKSGWSERGRVRADGKGGLMAGVQHDLRDALRGLRRSWTFTLVCLTSIAAGIAINAAILLLMRTTIGPPPGVEAEGAVELAVTTRGGGSDGAWSHPDFADVVRAETGMDLTGWVAGTRNLRTDDGSDGAQVRAMYVSANYFRTVGVDIAPGRAFASDEDDVTAEPPVIVSYRFWQTRLAADAQIIGRPLSLNGVIHRVIGVTPRGFSGHHAQYSGIEVWLPVWEHPLVGIRGRLRHDRAADRMHVIGRLHEGISLAQANGALGAVMQGLADAYPESNAQRRARVVPYSWQGGGFVGVHIRALFMAPAVVVLIVVCVNLAGMVLVRNATRERELALRLALGSSRWRIVRHLVTEPALLSLVGGALGVAILWVPLRAVAVHYGAVIPEHLDMTLAGMGLGLAFITTLVMGLAPALRFSRPRLSLPIRNDAGGGGRSSRLHRAAISIQTAIALPLLVINAMILQATRLMDEAEFGFDPQNLFVATLDLGAEGYRIEEVESFVRRLQDGAASIAGVESVSIADGIPLDYARRYRRIARSGETDYLTVRDTRVSPSYFETIRTPVLRGRAFDEGDVAGTEPVAMVTASLAARLWPGEEALGRRIGLAMDRMNVQELTVVGVVGDVAGSSHESSPNNLFVPLSQHPTERITLVVRTVSEDAAVAHAIEAAALELDPDLPRLTVVPSSSLMKAPRREAYIGSAFVGGLTLLTLLLAALGVYGVVAFAVTSRTHEIGVRMAIGATRQNVLWNVLAGGAKLAAPGIIVGTLLTVAISRSMLSPWYRYLDRTTLDPVILGAGASIAFAVVLLASGLPARRAAAIEPMVALRGDTRGVSHRG